MYTKNSSDSRVHPGILAARLSRDFSVMSPIDDGTKSYAEGDSPISIGHSLNRVDDVDMGIPLSGSWNALYSLSAREFLLISKWVGQQDERFEVGAESPLPKSLSVPYFGKLKKFLLFSNELMSSVHTNGSEYNPNTLGQKIGEKLSAIWREAKDEQFEVGMESLFSESLDSLHSENPTQLLSLLSKRLSDTHADTEVLVEMLRWASRQEVAEGDNGVFKLLSQGILHEDALVRDAAALGLANLDDAKAIGPLREAIKREKVPELKDDLQALVQSLET